MRGEYGQPQTLVSPRKCEILSKRPCRVPRAWALWEEEKEVATVEAARVAVATEAARAVARAAGSAAAGSEAARLAEVSEEARFAPLCRRSLRRMREQEQRGQIGGTPLYSRMKRFLTSVCNLRDAAGCSLRNEGAS